MRSRREIGHGTRGSVATSSDSRGSSSTFAQPMLRVAMRSSPWHSSPRPFSKRSSRRREMVSVADLDGARRRRPVGHRDATSAARQTAAASEAWTAGVRARRTRAEVVSRTPRAPLLLGESSSGQRARAHRQHRRHWLDVTLRLCAGYSGHQRTTTGGGTTTTTTSSTTTTTTTGGSWGRRLWEELQPNRRARLTLSPGGAADVHHMPQCARNIWTKPHSLRRWTA